MPLIGTGSYSLIGRPYIRNAKVEAIIESISESEKVIVFKKKRRKNYKRSFGNRQTLTQCRITRIVHDLTQDVLDRAIALQWLRLTNPYSSIIYFCVHGLRKAFADLIINYSLGDSFSFDIFKLIQKKMMQKDLLGGILNNIVLEKVVRDKIVMQQKEQRE